MEEENKIFCKDRKEWRTWLKENYFLLKVIWLIYYKKHTGKLSVSYNDAVEEAICFGWIDGQIKRIDDEKYMQRFTPRQAKSQWSLNNIKRARRMIEQGLMIQEGLDIFRNGIKDKSK